jgi:hypothetical protein
MTLANEYAFDKQAGGQKRRATPEIHAKRAVPRQEADAETNPSSNRRKFKIVEDARASRGDSWGPCDWGRHESNFCANGH